MSGDYQLEDTLYIPFTSRAFSSGIPFVLAGSPVVTGHRDANVTQFTTGITLAVDFDSIVGLNMITVVATAVNNYVAGETYTLYLSAGTVDSVSVVGEVVGRFTLDMSAAALDLANGTDGLGAIKTDSAAILVDTAVIGALGAGLTALSTQASVDTIDGLVDEIKVATITNAAGADVATDVKAVKAETVLIVADTGELQTDWVDGGRLDLIQDAILVDTATTIPGTITTVDANVDAILVDTAEIGAAGAGLTVLSTQASVDVIDGLVDELKAAVITNAAGVDISADILVIDNFVDGIETTLGTAGAGLTNLGGTLSELAAVPADDVNMATMIGWLYIKARNKVTQTATTQLVLADDGSTTVGTSTVSDDATTATRGEYV